MTDDRSALDHLIPDALKDEGRYDPLRQVDPALLQQFLKLTGPVVRYFRTSVEGAWRLPREEGCLIVSNHAVFAIDAMAFFPSLYMETGRLVRGLADHNLFKVPVLSALMLELGAVDGNRDNAVRMLRAGEWVVCYPGGARDALKGAEERYRLQWEGRLGYLRVALAAGVPIVPVAGVGIDEAYVTLGRERSIGRRLFGKATYDLPILMGLGPMPLPVKFRFVIGEPVDLERAFGLGRIFADAPDEELLPAHRAIWRHTQALIDREVGRRVSRFF